LICKKRRLSTGKLLGAQPADLIRIGGVLLPGELERLSLAVNNHDQSKPLARTTWDCKFPKSIFRGWNYIMAASVVVAVPTLVFVFQRQLVESIKTSGIK
jgi:hypothetical protein